jgi:excisionase family DNA binding protein
MPHTDQHPASVTNGHTAPSIPRRELYSTGQIARMCGVRICTVIRWIDTGKLPAFRLPLRHRERRVNYDDLCEFLARNHDLLSAVDESEPSPPSAKGVKCQVAKVFQWRRQRSGKPANGQGENDENAAPAPAAVQRKDPTADEIRERANAIRREKGLPEF